MDKLSDMSYVGIIDLDPSDIKPYFDFDNYMVISLNSYFKNLISMNDFSLQDEYSVVIGDYDQYDRDLFIKECYLNKKRSLSELRKRMTPRNDY